MRTNLPATLLIAGLALLVGVSTLAPTVQAASEPVTKQELREYTQRCQSIRDAARKCTAIRMETICLDGSGKTSTTMLSSKQTEDIRRIFSTGLQPFHGNHDMFVSYAELRILYFLDGNGKVSASVRSDEVAPTGDEHSGSLVMFTLPEDDFKLYWSIICQ